MALVAQLWLTYNGALWALFCELLLLQWTACASPYFAAVCQA
jgi:hypothetical protein